MARWIISPVIGDGTDRIITGQESTTGPYRPKAANYATEWGGVIPGNADGTPAFNWCIVRATAGDLAAADADTDLIVFPDLDMDHVLTIAQRNWLISRLDARGFNSGWVDPGITVLQVLRTIGRWLEANFDVTWIGGGS